MTKMDPHPSNRFLLITVENKYSMVVGSEIKIENAISACFDLSGSKIFAALPDGIQIYTFDSNAKTIAKEKHIPNPNIEGFKKGKSTLFFRASSSF
jgi:hypothetical protein